MTRHVDIVFDRPPGPEAPRFIEVEDAGGRSIRFGTWIERPDGTWALRITREELLHLAAPAEPIDAPVRIIRPQLDQ